MMMYLNMIPVFLLGVYVGRSITRQVMPKGFEMITKRENGYVMFTIRKVNSSRDGCGTIGIRE